MKTIYTFISQSFSHLPLLGRGCLFFLFSLSLGEGWGEALAQDYKGLVFVEGREFREVGDSLYVSFDIRVDSKASPNCGSVIFEPQISVDGGGPQLSLPYIQLTGRARVNLNRRWFAITSDEWLSHYEAPRFQINTNEQTNEMFTYSIRVPYEEWMDNSRFSLKQEITGCRGESRLYVYSLANRVELSPRIPYEVNPLVAMVEPDAEIKTRNRQGSAFLDFQVGRSVILPEFRRNPVELTKINDAVSGIADDPDIQMTGMIVEGFASPEGSYKSNDKLSYNRALALKEYIRTRYAFPDALFTVKNTAEDWNGLKILVEESSLEPKADLLAIITNDEAPDARELRLKRVNKGIPYRKMLTELYPDLRRVEYRVDYSVRNYTLTEAKEVIKRSPEHLSQLEMYKVAEDYGVDSKEYRDIIMELIPRYYPNDPVANSNAAA
ncbi:hypothetical protein, partial [Bacteroides sp. 224]|uniref:hypothetical protein n=1 Tax=Bacteroides sp. 224 TaxID=2302936 RepID=UPI0013D101A2